MLSRLDLNVCFTNKQMYLYMLCNNVYDVRSLRILVPVVMTIGQFFERAWWAQCGGLQNV